MPTYTISVRIESPNLDVAQVTNELGIQPTQTRHRGDRRSESTVWKNALWEFEVFQHNRSEWESLEAGLIELLKVLTPRVQLLRKYQESNDVNLWCGVFCSGFSSGPRLSAEVLGKLSALGTPISLAIYPSTTESDEKADSSLRSE
jgi:hypothetical protein